MKLTAKLKVRFEDPDEAETWDIPQSAYDLFNAAVEAAAEEIGDLDLVAEVEWSVD